MRWLLSVALCFLCIVANAADVEVNGSGLIVRNGFRAGDLLRIQKLLRGRRVIELQSWGGDGDTAMDIADYVYWHHVDIVVNGVCTSGCAFPALVAMSQGRLWLGPQAIIGVHMAKNTKTGVPNKGWTRQAMRMLASYGVPDAALDPMLVTPPDLMHFFNNDELVSWGAKKGAPKRPIDKGQ